MTDIDRQRAVASTAFDLHAVVTYVRATNTKRNGFSTIAGVRCIHDWLSDYPGATWQEKWVAADGDNKIEDVFLKSFEAAYPPGTDVPPRSTRQPRHLRNGLAILIGLGLIRPGPDYILFRTWKLALRHVKEDHADAIENVVQRTAEKVAVTADTARTARYALAAMIATTGKPLHEITVEDWMTVERSRSDLVRPYRAYVRSVDDAKANSKPLPERPNGLVTDDRIFSLRWAYSACVRAGAIAPHPHPPEGMSAVPINLDTALAKPKTIESLLDAQADVLTGRLYDFVRIVFEEHYAGHDFNTRRGVTTSLGAFLRAVEKTIPGNQSLNIGRAHAATIIEHLSTISVHGEPGSTSQREATPQVLSSVRRFFGYAAETAEDFDQFKDLIGPFPISSNVITALSRKYIKRSRSNLQNRIRSAITSIDDLVPATQLHSQHVNAFVEAALAANPGGTFTHCDIEYIRQDTLTHPSSRPMLSVRRNGGKRGPVDLLAVRHRAVRVRALVVLLRHTGIRREEVIEIAIDDLGFSLIDGTKVPCLHVGPAKTDTSRTIPMHNDVIHAFLDLINSYKNLYGEVPLAVRRDAYERQTLAPRRYLFQIEHDSSFITPELSSVSKWIEGFIADYNAIAKDLGEQALQILRPHDFRRIFATDLLDKDVAIESVRHLMGHTNIETTSVYDHTTWERAAAKFIDSHRSDSLPRRTGLAVPCPTCHGTGRVDSDLA